jgi:hypothetical protein
MSFSRYTSFHPPPHPPSTHQNLHHIPQVTVFHFFSQFRDILLLHTSLALLFSPLIFYSNLYVCARHHLLFTAELYHSVFHECCTRFGVMLPVRGLICVRARIFDGRSGRKQKKVRVCMQQTEQDVLVKVKSG